MHRYLLLTLAILLFAGWAHGSRNELSSSLSIPLPHQFGQESYNSITSSTTFRTTDVKHLETIQDFVISTGGKHGDLLSHRFHSTNRDALISSIQHTTVRMEDGLEVPHGTSVHLAFSAMGQEFAYHLEPMYGMISANSKVEVHGENGLRETIPLKLQSYFLHTDDQWVSMMVHSDGTFSALIQRDGEVYQVDPHHVHAEAMESEHHYNTLAASSRHGMTIFRHSDLLSSKDGGKDHMCGAVSSEGVAAQERGETIQKSHIHAHPQRNLLQTATGLDPFNCGQRVGTSGYAGVTAGQVVDYGMYLRAGNPTAAPATATVQKATDYVQSVYAMMNAVFAPQLLVMLQLQTVQVETTHDQTNGKLWNVRPRVNGLRCDAANGLAVTPAGAPYASDIEKALTDFSAYVGAAKAGTNSFWHQMSNCYPPSGVVGIAYVGSICQRLRTGVSTFSTTTYLTMAHEIAHNFGADHTFQLGQGRTGGIMDYNLNTFRGVIQFNIIYSRTDLCGSLVSLSADPTGARRLAGGVQPYCIAALNAPAGTTPTPVPTLRPATNAPATNAPATVRPTVAPGRTPYTLAQIAQHRTAQDCWVAIGTNVYDITRWNVPGVHPAGAVITTTCGTDATRVYNANHQSGATYLTTLLARDVIGVLTTATQPTNPPTQPPATPRPVTPAPTTSPATRPPTVAPPGGIMYYWAVTKFSDCPVDCEGTQTRMVVCVNGNNRNNLITVPDTFCLNGGALNGQRPPSSQACGTACPVRFAPIPGQAGTCQGTNGATCSAMAGGQGVLSQPVQCVKTQNNVNVVVADAVCLTAGIAKPATNTPCNLPTCTAQYTWAYGMWSGCSATCGGGTETRRVACVSVRMDATTRATIIELAESSTCQSMFGNGPVSSRACNTQACVTNSQRYQWTITSDFTPCSAPCGGGQQARTAYCTDGYMKQVVPGYQCPNAPVLTQPCNTQACAVYVWVTGRAGQCSAPCGPSTANRPVTCVNQNDRMMTPVNASLCLQSEQPAATVPCNLGACPTGTTPAPTTPSTPPPQQGDNETPDDGDDDGSSTPQGPLAVYALNTVATHAIPSDCWAVVNKLVYNLSYFGLDPVVDGVSHPVSGSLINAICGTDVSVVFSQVHKAGTNQLPIVTKRLIGKVGANTPDPVFPPPIGNQAYSWYIDTVGIQCGPTPVDKCTVVSTSTPKCVNLGAQSMVTIDNVYCAKQPNPATDPNQPRVGQPCPVNAQNPNPCTQNNPNSAKHHILSSISSQSQSQHPLSRRTVHITAALSGSGPQWLTGIPSQCTVMCGGGTQVRNVTCVDGATGATLPSTSCDGLIKPSELLECGMQPCNAFWSVGPWNQCSAPCGGIGTQTREVDCRSSASSSGLGMVMGDAQCLLTAAKPSTQQTCNAQACPQWVGGAWTECSELCGVGVQTKIGVRCENSYGLVVDDSECLASSQFNRMRPCNAGPCPVYDHGPWGQCSATCGGGNQTREVLCRTKNHNAHEGAIEYNMTICDMYDGDGRAKGNHVTQQACNEQPCGDLYWRILPTKFLCSAACDGGIVRITSVCMKRDGNTETQVADDVCQRNTMLSKPKDILECNTQPCAPKYVWDPSKWSECSSFCGDGTQTREVTCIDLDSKAVSPGKCSSSNPFATIRACSEPVSKCWGNVRKGDMKTGECIVDPTSPLNGTCQCRSGWAGNDCSVNPGITNVYFENTKYAHGIPVGADEKMVIRWNSYGSNKDVSILLLRDDNTAFFAQYLARGIANTGVFEWNVGSILDDLPFANKYVVQVMMKNTAFGRSARFQTADACQYKACGMNAVCQSGKCVCQPGYTGANCQISPCEKLGCDSARSTCDNAQPVCKCAEGWTGPRCKTPVSCVDMLKCANGGDYIHPVDMPVTNPLTCPLDASDVNCDCKGSWTNTTCNVCGLKCMNGGVPNRDCTSCNCPAGYTGDTCSCRYYDIKAKLNYDTSKWTPQTLSVSSRRLQQTFANDMAAGIIGLNANQFIFTSFAITGSQIDMGVRLTDQCSFIAPDLLMTGNPRTAMAISGGVDPTKSGTLQDIYQQLLAQLKSLDSVLLQGYITSSIVPGSVVVTDPLALSSTQQPEQPGTPSDPFGPAPADNGRPGNNPPTQKPTSSSSSISIMLIGIIVGGVVGVLLLVGAIIYFMRMRKSQSTSKRTLTKVSLDQLPSGHTSNPSPTSATPPRAWDSQAVQQNYQ